MSYIVINLVFKLVLEHIFFIYDLHVVILEVRQ